jgi:Holliday junction resolvasome RuvABC endonuclease subunit
MAKDRRTVIGISPGSRHTGFAVIRNGDLREWGVKVLHGKRSQKKLEYTKQLIVELIDLYDPAALSIKELHPSRRSPYLRALVSAFKAVARNRKIPIFEYGIESLKEESAATENINNKLKLAEIMTAKYPVLFRELNEERSHKIPYRVRMFEAVALADAGSRKLGGHRQTEIAKDIRPVAAL